MNPTRFHCPVTSETSHAIFVTAKGTAEDPLELLDF
jgi:hypothetical protein